MDVGLNILNRRSGQMVPELLRLPLADGVKIIKYLKLY